MFQGGIRRMFRLVVYVRPGWHILVDNCNRYPLIAAFICIFIHFVLKPELAVANASFWCGLGVTLFFLLYAFFWLLYPFRKAVLALKEKDLLLSDFESSSSCAGGRVRLGGTFVFLRKQEEVFTYRRIRYVRLKWVEGRGYVPEITLRNQKKFVFWEDGVELLTRWESSRYYLPIIREMIKQNPEIIHDLSEERPRKPEKEEPEEREEEMLKYLEPERNLPLKPLFILYLPRLVLISGLLLLSAWYVARQPYGSISLSVVIMAVSLFFICVSCEQMISAVRSERAKSSDFNKRMRSFRMHGLMDGMLRDFERSTPMVDGRLRFGEKYLFLPHTGNVLTYTDIRMITFSHVPIKRSCILLSVYTEDTWYLSQKPGGKEEGWLRIKVGFYREPDRVKNELRGVLNELKERQPELSVAGTNLIK